MLVLRSNIPKRWSYASWTANIQRMPFMCEQNTMLNLAFQIWESNATSRFRHTSQNVRKFRMYIQVFTVVVVAFHSIEVTFSELSGWLWLLHKLTAQMAKQKKNMATTEFKTVESSQTDETIVNHIGNVQDFFLDKNITAFHWIW